MVEGGLTLTLQRNHRRDTVLRDVLLDQPGEGLIVHVPLAHLAA